LVDNTRLHPLFRLELNFPHRNTDHFMRTADQRKNPSQRRGWKKLTEQRK